MRSSWFLASLASSLASASIISNCSIVGTYSVVSGDTLTKIAKNFNVSLAALEYENAQIENFNVLSINETINIPNPGCYVNLCNIVYNYTVAMGDDLSKIATKFNVSLAAIESVNTQIVDFNFITPGESIAIPDPTTCIVSGKGTATANCATGANSTYTIVSGDTFYVVANDKLGITLASLEAANPGLNYDVVEIGQVIKVPVCGTCVAPSYGATQYTVVHGDTFLIISTQKLNITLAAFEAANTQVKDFDVIDVGESLNVPICKTSTSG